MGSVDVNQNNSQNISIQGSGNKFSNIVTDLNLINYSPEIQSCVNKSITELKQNNQTKLNTNNTNNTIIKSESKNKALTSSNNIANSKNKIISKQDNDMKSKQKSISIQKTNNYTAIF